jgi:hypothetical protein
MSFFSSMTLKEKIADVLIRKKRNAIKKRDVFASKISWCRKY